MKLEDDEASSNSGRIDCIRIKVREVMGIPEGNDYIRKDELKA